MNTKSATIRRRRLLPLLALSGLATACSAEIKPTSTPRPDGLDTEDKRNVADYLEKLADKIGRTPSFILKWSRTFRRFGIVPQTWFLFETLYDADQLGQRLFDLGLSTIRRPVAMPDENEFWNSLFGMPDIYSSKFTINGTPIQSSPKKDYPGQHFWLCQIPGLSPKFNVIEVDHFAAAKSKFVYAYDSKRVVGNLVQLIAQDSLLHR